MEIRLKELSPEPQELRETKDFAWLAEALAGPAARPADGTTLEMVASVYTLNDNVFVSAKMDTALLLQCCRCATEWMQPTHYKFNLTLASAKPETKQEEEDVELTKDDVEFTYFTGEKIALDDAFREELILQTPEYPLCRADCRGLCPRCGIDLNKGSCACVQEAIDPRLAALKNIKLQKRS
jgi:uncharacterized protein